MGDEDKKGLAVLADETVAGHEKRERLWMERLCVDDEANQRIQDELYQQLLWQHPDLERIGEEQSRKALEEWGLELDYISPLLREQARKAFGQGDALGLMCLMNNTVQLDFVVSNIRPLKNRGIYEGALVNALTAAKINYRGWPSCYQEHLLRTGDISRLRAAGDPLPQGNAFTVYRGVAGHGCHRKVRGISWTSSIDQACWFALRLVEYGVADPAVYRAQVKRDEVYCYINDRNEQEFICRPKYVTRLKLRLEQMRQGSCRAKNSQ